MKSYEVIAWNHLGNHKNGKILSGRIVKYKIELGSRDDAT